MSKLLRLAMIPVLAIGLAACGGSDTPSAGGESPAGSTAGEPAAGGSSSIDAYLTEVCGAMNDWTDSLTSSGSDLDPSVMTDPAAARTKVADLFNDLADRTQEAIDRVDAAGAPDIPRGDELQQAVLDNLTTLRDAYRETAEKIESGDLQGLQEIFQGFVQDLQNDIQAIQDRFADITSDPDVQAAFDGQVPDCSQLS